MIEVAEIIFILTDLCIASNTTTVISIIRVHILMLNIFSVLYLSINGINFNVSTIYPY